MTSVPAADNLRTRAARFVPSWARVAAFLVAIVTAIPAALGWLARLVWTLLLLLVLGFVVGWETAGHQLGTRATPEE